MRLESATVPAAVMPGCLCNDGFRLYLPLFNNNEWEGAWNRDKSEDLPKLDRSGLSG